MLYVLRDALGVRLSIGSLEQSVYRPETEENTKFITRSIWLVYLYLTHISILYLVSGSLSQQKSIFLPYTPSPSFPFHQGKSSTFGHIIKVKKKHVLVRNKKKTAKCQKVFLQKIFDFEGFRPSGVNNRILHKKSV